MRGERAKRDRWDLAGTPSRSSLSLASSSLVFCSEFVGDNI